MRPRSIYRCKNCLDMNWFIECACGCGTVIGRYSKHGDLRRFLNGHYTRIRKQHGSDNKMWNGGKSINPCGYMLVKRRDHPFANNHGYVFEHRIVYEETYNCILMPWVTLHHKDGNKLNNVWYNLEHISRGKHSSVHMKERWASGEMRELLCHTTSPASESSVCL